MKPEVIEKGKFFSSILKLTRFGNLLIIGLAQYFTAYFLIGPHILTDIKLLFLSLSTTLIAAAGYIINDYYDVKIDYINKPDRVVIGKTITRRYAILFHVFLSTAGLALGILLGWRIAAINLMSIFLLWFYSNLLKRLPVIGNFTVAMLTGLSILVVDFLYKTDESLIYIYAIFAFFMTWMREIIKDMEDLKGDNSFGCKTLPIVWGIRRTKWVIYFLLIVLCATVFILDFFYSALPLRYYTLFLFIPLVIFTFLLARADMKKDFTTLSSFCKIIMLLGILSMAVV
ncbi:MAG TPA: geranylgeranylglycerol-phosphate geranylgeranyltransferase [Ohtaekwangia sp.]|nr:geranylgeranylglycerol-phosphate geranylgeranyltransferase [Ohtaekwangia sp.]